MEKLTNKSSLFSIPEKPSPEYILGIDPCRVSTDTESAILGVKLCGGTAVIQYRNEQEAKEQFQNIVAAYNKVPVFDETTGKWIKP